MLRTYACNCPPAIPIGDFLSEQIARWIMNNRKMRHPGVARYSIAKSCASSCMSIFQMVPVKEWEKAFSIVAIKHARRYLFF